MENGLKEMLRQMTNVGSPLRHHGTSTTTSSLYCGVHKCWELVSAAAHSLGTLSPGFLINFVSLHLSTEQLMCDLQEHSEDLQGVDFWVELCIVNRIHCR